MTEPWQVGDYRFLLSVVMGIIRQSGEEESLEKIINAWNTLFFVRNQENGERSVTVTKKC